MTVGMPTAMTGTPIVCAEISLRLLFRPLPGVMPVSDNCTVAARRAILRDMSASMAMTAVGWILPTTPLMISALSTPVWPSTPGEMAATSPSWNSR